MRDRELAGILVAVGRPDDVRAHRHHASIKPPHRARAKSGPKRAPLGTPEAGEGPMREDGNDVRFGAHYGLKSDIG
jgi:hypothetical protein